MPDHVTDHNAQTFDKLLEQLKDVDGWAKLITIITTQIQELEDVFFDIRATRFLAGAGDQLDQLGRILQEPRAGANDTDYKVRLTAKILVLRSSGTLTQILTIFKRLLPSNKIWFRQFGGAGFILDIGTIDTAFLPTYVRFLRQAKTAGVNAHLQYQQVADPNAFHFDVGPGFDVGHLAGEVIV